MKKIFIFLFMINSVILLFAGSTPERDRQAYEQVQLKIVNLSNGTIKFHFNKLYLDTYIGSQEEYVTMNTPVNREYPGLIAIEKNITYDKSRSINYYQFSAYKSDELRFPSNRQYIVLVMESAIHFIEGSVDGEYDYFDESLYESGGELDWHKVTVGENRIHVHFTNNSNTRQNILIETILWERNSIALESNESNSSYYIDDRLFSISGIEIVIFSNEGAYERIMLENNTQKSRENKFYNITLTINENGYEISYH